MATQDDPRVVAMAKEIGVRGPKHFAARYGMRLDDLSPNKAIEIMERHENQKRQNAEAEARFWTELTRKAETDNGNRNQRPRERTPQSTLRQTGEQDGKLRFGDPDAIRRARAARH